MSYMKSPPKGYIDECWGVVPARKGSKGLPGKNKKMLGGRELYMWAIKAGLDAGLDKVILSTDYRDLFFPDKKIAICYRQRGLSGDKITVKLVFKRMFEHYYKRYPEYFAILQPSSPFIRPDDIIDGLNRLKSDKNAHSFQTIREISHLDHSYNQRMIQDNETYIQFAHPERRGGSNLKQHYPKHYALGNLIITKTRYFSQMGDFFGNSLFKIIPKEYCVDIDFIEDFEEAQRLYGSGRVKV